MKAQNVPSPALFTLSIQEFIALQKILLKEELLKMTSSFKSGSSSTYYNFDESVAFLKISKPTFSKIRKQGLIKGYMVSENRILFSETDLQQYLDDKKEQ
jgi:hypothetical protein